MVQLTCGSFLGLMKCGINDLVYIKDQVAWRNTQIITGCFRVGYQWGTTLPSFHPSLIKTPSSQRLNIIAFHLFSAQLSFVPQSESSA